MSDLGNGLELNTTQVDSIAGEIETLNNRLRDTLNESQEKMAALSAAWEGEAADETLEGYKAFANQYFEEYESMITEYVRFLRDDVADAYEGVERGNIDVGSSFL
ncbi:MAG: WXG100 family type VII secretion target [Peptococcaceae bacterium]|nr:WXG100 family type VII secretion target [Peptococcaceae bacterium]